MSFYYTLLSLKFDERFTIDEKISILFSNKEYFSRPEVLYQDMCVLCVAKIIIECIKESRNDKNRRNKMKEKKKIGTTCLGSGDGYGVVIEEFKTEKEAKKYIKELKNILKDIKK